MEEIDQEYPLEQLIPNCPNNCKLPEFNPSNLLTSTLNSIATIKDILAENIYADCFAFVAGASTCYMLTYLLRLGINKHINSRNTNYTNLEAQEDYTNLHSDIQGYLNLNNKKEPYNKQQNNSMLESIAYFLKSLVS